ncbi:hypothetical protein AB840_09630 [Megasphaera cerevisiae DSM 20462]|uniref:ATP synthase subunit I n=1 Tax=Megasphaera cerevisiae DSM 20462 TaxID=1122219 RepID=A0A0J6WWH3_9FIRM|nr:hypothetical protein [Megasphaera cerevisiae]KMO86167.1 hypothetical protein AB840_09630 [Megasphaera cerevisiae DSM 20462]SJZ40208.1 hypothetical protein SAMN05660900_00261 [Megasphaera cerevisiae DSM 20462]
MTEFVQYVKATVLKLIGLTCIVAAVLFVVGWRQCVTGWCIGSGLNIVYFLMLSSRSVRALKLPPGQAAAFIRSGAVFRLFMIGLILIVILQFPGIHFGAAVAGIFSYRMIVFADGIAALVRTRVRKEV